MQKKQDCNTLAFIPAVDNLARGYDAKIASPSFIQAATNYPVA